MSGTVALLPAVRGGSRLAAVAVVDVAVVAAVVDHRRSTENRDWRAFAIVDDCGRYSRCGYAPRLQNS